MKQNRAEWLAAASCLAALLILLLYLTIPETASAEYRYTVEIVFGAVFLPLCILAIAASRKTRKFLRNFWSSRYNWHVMLVFGIAIICVPIFSPREIFLERFWKNMLSFCWVAGSLSLSLGIFFLAAKIGGALAGLFCLVASLLLFFGLTESFYLATDQFLDTYVQASAKSKYVVQNMAQATLPLKKDDKRVMPVRPEHPSGAYAHREDYRGKPLFDARYVFDKNNRRTMPAVSEKPGAEILLFGCSYTFGHGLENEETWAWLLSKDLGPDWKITNYAFNGYGAHQMLDLLEDKLVEMPTAPFRQAIFLAIRHQLHRSSGLFDMRSSRYVLKDGIAARDGLTTDSPWFLLNSLPRALNGSQAVREISRRLVNVLRDKKHDEFLRIYVSLIGQAAKILENQCHTPLLVLVWPDLDELVPELEKIGVKAISMRKMLPQWNEPDGSNYHIVKNCEYHPNQQATREIAAGVAAILRKEREIRGQ